MGRENFRLRYDYENDQLQTAFRFEIKGQVQKICADIRNHRADRLDREISETLGAIWPQAKWVTQFSTPTSCVLIRELGLTDEEGLKHQAFEKITYDGHWLSTNLVEGTTLDEIKKLVNPFESRHVASETAAAGLCPECISSNIAQPLDDFLKQTKEVLTPACHSVADPNDKPSSPRIDLLSGVASCLRGLAASLVDVVHGLYDLITFLLKSTLDANYQLALASKASQAFMSLVRHPLPMISAIYQQIARSLMAKYEHFKECDSRFQTEAVCKVMSDLLLPGGALNQALRRLKLVEKVTATTPKLSEWISAHAEKISASAKVDGAQEIVAITSIPQRSTELVAKATRTKRPLETNLVQQNRIKKREELMAVQQTPAAQKALAAFKKYTSVTDKKSAEFKQAQTEYRESLERLFDQTGIKYRSTNSNVLYLEDRVESVKANLAKWQNQGLGPGHRIFDHSQKSLRRAKRELAVALKQPSDDFVLVVDLNSNKMLQNLRDKWGLKKLIIREEIDSAGFYRDSTKEISIQGGQMAQTGGRFDLSGTFFHEVHHLANARNREQIVPGHFFGNITDYVEERHYAHDFTLDELTAYRRTFRYDEIGLQPASMATLEIERDLIERARNATIAAQGVVAEAVRKKRKKMRDIEFTKNDVTIYYDEFRNISLTIPGLADLRGVARHQAVLDHLEALEAQIKSDLLMIRDDSLRLSRQKIPRAKSD
jgi:hypothetical protein